MPRPPKFVADLAARGRATRQALGSGKPRQTLLADLEAALAGAEAPLAPGARRAMEVSLGRHRGDLPWDDPGYDPLQNMLAALYRADGVPSRTARDLAQKRVAAWLAGNPGEMPIKMAPTETQLAPLAPRAPAKPRAPRAPRAKAPAPAPAPAPALAPLQPDVPAMLQRGSAPAPPEPAPSFWQKVIRALGLR